MDETFEQRWWRMNVESIADSITDLNSKHDFIRENLKEFRQKFISRDASILEKEILHKLSDLEKAIESKKTDANNQLLRALIERLNDVGQITTEVNSNIPPIVKGKSETIAEILEPLRSVFDSNSHIDTIVSALVAYSDNASLPMLQNTKTKHILNKDFYPYFKEVHNRLGIPISGIANVLTYLICQGNGRNILPTTIEKNINSIYSK